MTTEQSHDPSFRTIDMSAETKKMYGPRWNEPEEEYRFADGKRVFKRRTGDAAIYETSPGFA